MSLRLYRVSHHLSAGEPLEACGWRVTPLARALLWRGRGGLVSLRPCAVHTQRGNEHALVPVPDATCRWQLGALGAGLLVGWLLAWRVRKRVG